MKKIQDLIISFQNSSKQGFQYALFFALHLVLLFNPIADKNVAVKSFSRTFGSGIINNWDCSRVISNFYFWCISFTLLLFVFWILFNSWKQNDCRSDEENNVVTFLDNFMILGCVNIVLKAFPLFNKKPGEMFFIYSNLIVDFIVGVAFLYLIFHCAIKFYLLIG